ncbi:hypothetical protein QQP08_012599 [Theobroma cacao]|nr:hypothetical protein QQP08_012599 [Theobroma cacao]
MVNYIEKNESTSLTLPVDATEQQGLLDSIGDRSSFEPSSIQLPRSASRLLFFTIEISKDRAQYVDEFCFSPFLPGAGRESACLSELSHQMLGDRHCLMESTEGSSWLFHFQQQALLQPLEVEMVREKA